TAPGAKLDILTGNLIAERSATLAAGGTGVFGLSSATTGSGVGVVGEAGSASGIAGVFRNAADGKLLSGRDSAGREVFSVDINKGLNIGVSGLLSSPLPGTALTATGGTAVVANGDDHGIIAGAHGIGVSGSGEIAGVFAESALGGVAG